MKRFAMMLTLTAACLFVALGCNRTTQSRDVSDQVRQSLDQSGLKDVSVSQDRDKGVVTLKGDVPTDAEKGQAESIAKRIAPDQVVANEISVRPAGDSTAAKVDSALDEGIENNLDAALVQSRLKDGVDYDVKNGVVTLTGDVGSQQQRTRAAEVAKSVPNVKQVVNELQVKNQKANSSR